MADWPYSTNTWAALRRAKLQETPLCEACTRMGQIVAASHVDHRVAIAAGGPAFPTLDGLASLCPSCHATKTNAEDRPDRRAGAGVYRGCGVDGLPLDPAHPFVAGGRGLHEPGAAASRTGPTANAQLVRRRRGGCWPPRTWREAPLQAGAARS